MPEHRDRPGEDDDRREPAGQRVDERQLGRPVGVRERDTYTVSSSVEASAYGHTDGSALHQTRANGAAIATDNTKVAAVAAWTSWARASKQIPGRVERSRAERESEGG